MGEAGKQLREKGANVDLPTQEDEWNLSDWAAAIVGVGADLPGFQPKAFPIRGGTALPTFAAPTIRPHDAEIIRLAYLFPMTWENVQAFLITLPAGRNEVHAHFLKFNLPDEGLKQMYEPFWQRLEAWAAPAPGQKGWELWKVFQSVAQTTLLFLAGPDDAPLDYPFLDTLARVVASLLDKATYTEFSGPGPQLETRAQYRDWLRYYGDPFTRTSYHRTIAVWVSQARDIIADGGQSVHTCENCGRLFLQATARREFCSNSCRQKRHRDRKKKESDIIGGTC